MNRLLATLSPARLAGLKTQHASQLEITPTSQTLYFGLNTRVAPFNDLRVRRAVSFAIDRNALVQAAGGRDFAQPSCQVLPPNFESYRRYCPYTINPRPDGAYTGPDLATARKLVAASGTHGQAVTVWIPKCCSQWAALLVAALNKLGYNARLHIVNDIATYQNAIFDSRRKIQAFGQGWGADYTAAGGIIPANLTCGSFLPGTPANGNLAEFCNPKIDAEITRARLLQTTDPQAASQLWSQIDRDIVDQAPWIIRLAPNNADFVTPRVRNYQYSPQWGTLYDQLWVR